MVSVFKSMFLFSCLSFSCFSCVITKYVNYEKGCLRHNPNWKLYVDMPPLKDLMIRVDSLNHKGKIKTALSESMINFHLFELFVTMNRELPKPFVPTANRKPRFTEEMIQINLYVSDTLDESTIIMLKREDSNDNIEKGYIGHNSFLYVNDYQSDTYLLVNLRTRIAYKLEQEEENLQHTYRALNDFVKKECYQGIQFLTAGGTFSLGDYLMY